jgi:hypothetical protein
MRGRGGLVLGHGLPDLWFDEGDLRDPWRLAPQGDVTVTPEAPAPSQPLGTTYQPANENVTSAEPEPFEVDPNERDRSTRLHAATQNALSQIVEDRGCTPHSRSGEPNYDLAWEEPDGTTIVAEVKSVKAINSERQLRLGLGQVLRYRHLLEAEGRSVRGVLALSGPPHDSRWTDLCAEHDIGLIWMPDLEAMLTAWLSGP